MAQKRGLTAYHKIVKAHLLKVLEDGRLVLRIDKRFCHEITTPNAIIEGRSRGLDIVRDPNTVKAMIDHISPAKDTLSAVQGQLVRDWCRQHGIEFLDVGRNGVCHAIIPEMGWILPGETAVMGDSHTCTHGAFGAFAAGVGSTDLLLAIATGLWVCPPQKVIRVNFNGKLPNAVFAKDLILSLIGKIGVKGATNAVLEFGGNIIEEMSMDARMTVTNMAVEAGATTGMIAVDQTTVDYLWEAIKDNFNEDAHPSQILEVMQQWNSDDDAVYDRMIEFDVTDMVPVMTEGYTVEEVVEVSQLAGKKIDQVYIGSCTNGRLEDMRIAADIFETHGPVAAGVRCIVNPATPEVKMMMIEEGLYQTLHEAGCCITNPNCGACLGLSCGVLAPGEVCVSTTNRNFPGRMGDGGMVHLASPATAAFTAIRGVVTVPENLEEREYYVTEPIIAKPSAWPKIQCQAVDYAELAAKQAGGASDFSGKPFYLPLDNIDTDQIIPGRCLTIIDKAEMGRHCLEDARIEPAMRPQLANSQILVAGENFGCGSSREHAPWALEAAGIRCVIARSFARIFENNMFANGLLCLALDREMMDFIFREMPEHIKLDVAAGRIHFYKEGLFSDDTPVKRLAFELSDHQKQLIQNGGSIGVMLNLAAELQQAGKL